MLNLYFFRELEQDEVIRALLRFREDGSTEDYFKAANGLIQFAQQRALTRHTLAEYVYRIMLRGSALLRPAEWADYLKHDLHEICRALLLPDWDALCSGCGLLPISGLPTREPDTGELTGFAESLNRLAQAGDETEIFRLLAEHCARFGTGENAEYAALRWKDGKLSGIAHIDHITFDDLTGLDYPKRVLIENTEAFLHGRPANNILLAGDSGTGKSSCVKACLNRFKESGLRLIEAGKESISDLPAMMQQLKGQALKYIIFVDDLSFESGDSSYKQLKSALDGQVEQHPENVLIYATSNRRHIIKETWSEREGADGDDIHRSDALSEKRSLSERFGITLYFLAPDQEEYLRIVTDMLRKNGVEADEMARREALAWAVGLHGRSGRTAKQFVADYLAGR